VWTWPRRVGGRPERLPGRRTELQLFVAKGDHNAAGGCGQRDKADLDGVGHGQILQNSGVFRAGSGPAAFAALVSMMARIGLAGTMACPPPPCQAPPWPQSHKPRIINHI